MSRLLLAALVVVTGCGPATVPAVGSNGVDSGTPVTDAGTTT